MRFYSENECEEWLTSRGRALPVSGSGVRYEYLDRQSRIRNFARTIARIACFGQPALLWVKESEIWTVNWHHYYRLRQSYSDHRLLNEAPGHLFLAYQQADLETFLELTMANGWDAHLLTEADYVNVYFSHDEYLEIFSEDAATLSELEKSFTR